SSGLRRMPGGGGCPLLTTRRQPPFLPRRPCQTRSRLLPEMSPSQLGTYLPTRLALTWFHTPSWPCTPSPTTRFCPSSSTTRAGRQATPPLAFPSSSRAASASAPTRSEPSSLCTESLAELCNSSSFRSSVLALACSTVSEQPVR